MYSSRLPIATTIGHVSRAVAFNNQTLYLGLGRTEPWENENGDDIIPPIPNVSSGKVTHNADGTFTIDGFDDLIGMKRITKQYLVYPDEDGDIVYRNRTWSKCNTLQEAREHEAHYVYLETNINYDELPCVDYRCIGIFSSVQVHEGVTSDAIVPTDISDVDNPIYGIDDPGALEILDNRRVVTRADDSRDSFSMIIEL